MLISHHFTTKSVCSGNDHRTFYVMPLPTHMHLWNCMEYYRNISGDVNDQWFCPMMTSSSRLDCCWDLIGSGLFVFLHGGLKKPAEGRRRPNDQHSVCLGKNANIGWNWYFSHPFKPMDQQSYINHHKSIPILAFCVPSPGKSKRYVLTISQLKGFPPLSSSWRCAWRVTSSRKLPKAAA